MIRLYRLSTGEDVIGTLPVEEGDPLQEGELENHIDYEYIKETFCIDSNATWSTYVNRFSSVYIPYTKDEVIKIKKDNIITSTNPDTNLIDAYDKEYK